MLRILEAAALVRLPDLRSGMFRDRAAQFSDRLSWEVDVDVRGEERDQYDALGPVYVIFEEDGRHRGSMRFLPTTGRTMLAEHFPDLTGGVRIRSPFIWECTRFCLAPGAGRRVATALMFGGFHVGVRNGLTHAVGVFNAPMIRVYRRLGWEPAVLGTRGIGRSAISAGLWAFTPEVEADLLVAGGVSAAEARAWIGPEPVAAE